MSKTFAYLGLVMGAIFVGFGILIVFSPPDVKMIQENNYLIAFIVLMYGAFRVYRSVRMLNEIRDRLDQGEH
ncbi:MAG: hypothetical protein AAF570_18260 [Bacteroidota bacterium]